MVAETAVVVMQVTSRSESTLRWDGMTDTIQERLQTSSMIFLGFQAARLTQLIWQTISVSFHFLLMMPAVQSSFLKKISHCHTCMLIQRLQLVAVTKVVVAVEEAVETEAVVVTVALVVTVDSDATEALAVTEAEETADLVVETVMVDVLDVTVTDHAVEATAVQMFILQHREAAAQVSLRSLAVQLNINN